METALPSLPCSQGWSCDWLVANGEESCVLRCWAPPLKGSKGLCPSIPSAPPCWLATGTGSTLCEKPHPEDDTAARWKEPEALNTAEKNHPKGSDFTRKGDKPSDGRHCDVGSLSGSLGCDLLGRKLRLERQTGARRPHEEEADKNSKAHLLQVRVLVGVPRPVE